VLATGGSPRRLELGIPDDRVSYVRSVVDAQRLRSSLAPGRHVAIIGAGFIGGEVAASARARGAEVTMVEALAEPLALAFGPDIGRVIREIHSDHGVRVLTSTSVESARISGADVALRLSSGDVLRCDHVVVGIGLVPTTELAERAGLTCGNGIHVDHRCRTSVPGIYAAGDVAAHDHPLFGRRMRVEHHDNALKQGAAVAADVLGRGVPFDDPHWFWSDQYDHQIQGAGVFDVSDEVVVRGRLDEQRFTAFHLRDGRLVGAVGIDTGAEVRRAAKLIQARTPVRAGVLADRDADLRSLARLAS
jgi:3-phenylpropionate/trans-cinnamate dioxygenase ferredoxin reductase component